MNFDGKANDAIFASSFDKRAYSVITSGVSDTTTATAPVTTTPTTTAAPSTTAPPTTTAAPGATVPPTAAGGISVDLGPDQTVVEGVEVTLTASATPSTSTGVIVTYIWTEGDLILGQEGTLKKVFDKGTHEINVVVTDNVGQKANDTVIITVGAVGTGTAGDSDSDGWNDALEIQMGTDPHNPDTDGDGIIDSKDPNPLVAGSSGSILGEVPSILITIIKWVVIIGGGIVAIIFIREKILDMMWERNKDWSE
jgi:hypothetical protein